MNPPAPGTGEAAAPYGGDLVYGHFAAIVESAEDAIISKTLDGVVMSWNPAAEKIFGYTAAEMIGQPILRLVPPDARNEEIQILERLQRGHRIEHYETRRLHKDGREIAVALTVSPIKDQEGRIIGASKIARDISERRESLAREREALRRADTARRQAEAASRSKDEFLATVSHELRTPLTSILGWVRMLASGDLDPRARQKAIEIIDRNARSQAQLIEDLLDVSRVISGRLRIERKPVDLATVVRAAVEVAGPAAEAKGIVIENTVHDAALLAGDFERLQQVVWNLLSNAIRFTGRGGRIQVDVRQAESKLQLSVTDTGSGISPDFLPYVFNRFSQADSSSTRAHGGLGVGLAIVRSIVELHGGTVSAASDGEGMGASFSAVFPMAAIIGIETGDGDRPDFLHPREELSGLKLLVVDDEPDTCEMLRFIFDSCGADVRTAGSAEDALRLFDTWRPDMLIADIGMPQMDGYELIRRIRVERGSRMPAVALTALARIDDRVKALTAGFQMHVPKPVEPSELVDIVTGLTGLLAARG